MQKYWRIVLPGLLISGGAVYMIVSQIDMVSLGEALRLALNEQGLFWLLTACVVMTIGLLARAYRWRVLLSQGLPLRRAFHIMNIAYVLNGLLPLRIGEVARMWAASRPSGGHPGVQLFKSASTIILERLLDLLAVVVFIALGLVLAADRVPNELRATAGFMGTAAVVGFLTLVVFAGQRGLAQRILAFFVNRIPLLQRANLAEWLNHFLDGLKPLTHPVSLFNALFWTAASWGLSFAYGYMLMLIFYPQGDAVATLLYIAAASFAVALPAAPTNVGPYELSILGVFTALGYATDERAHATVVAFALVVHFMNLAVNALWGVVGFMAEGVSLTQLSAGVRQLREEQAEPAGQPPDEPAARISNPTGNTE